MIFYSNIPNVSLSYIYHNFAGHNLYQDFSGLSEAQDIKEELKILEIHL